MGNFNIPVFIPPPSEDIFIDAAKEQDAKIAPLLDAQVDATIAKAIEAEAPFKDFYANNKGEPYPERELPMRKTMGLKPTVSSFQRRIQRDAANAKIWWPAAIAARPEEAAQWAKEHPEDKFGTQAGKNYDLPLDPPEDMLKIKDFESYKAKKREEIAALSNDPVALRAARDKKIQTVATKLGMTVSDFILGTRTAKIALSDNFLTAASALQFVEWVESPQIRLNLAYQRYLKDSFSVNVDDLEPGTILYNLDSVSSLMPESDAHMHTIAAQSQNEFNGIDNDKFQAPPNVTHAAFLVRNRDDINKLRDAIRETRGDRFKTKAWRNTLNGLRPDITLAAFTPKSAEFRRLSIEAGNEVNGMPYSTEELSDSMKTGLPGTVAGYLNAPARAKIAATVTEQDPQKLSAMCSSAIAKIGLRAAWKQFAQEKNLTGLTQEQQYERARWADFMDSQYVPEFLRTDPRHISPRTSLHRSATDKESMYFAGILSVKPEDAGPQRWFASITEGEIPAPTEHEKKADTDLDNVD